MRLTVKKGMDKKAFLEYLTNKLAPITVEESWISGLFLTDISSIRDEHKESISPLIQLVSRALDVHPDHRWFDHCRKQQTTSGIIDELFEMIKTKL